MIGVNFWPRSPRYVSLDLASRIMKAMARRGVQTVGIFVNPRAEEISKTVQATGIDMIQLHGEETPNFVNSMPRPVIKALGGMAADPAGLEPYRAARYILLDTPHADQPGGTGRAWDWTQAREAASRFPVLLGGGLSPQNVRRAIQEAQPVGVDVASGVEQEPGRKDPDKVQEFIRLAKGVDDGERKSPGF